MSDAAAAPFATSAARSRRLAGTWLACVAVIMTAGGVTVWPQSAGSLNVCHAGSLTATFLELEKQFKAQYPNVAITDAAGGSVDLARQLATAIQECDVYAPADYTDIDLLLKPAALADYTIVFARGRMVLAYLASDPRTTGIAASGDFTPPAAIPEAVPRWYDILLKPGVRIGGAHPFLDPGGYRSHMIFQLAENAYAAPGLYNRLLGHYVVYPAGGGPGEAFVLGQQYSFQFIYEHSAQAAATTNPAYRYVRLPDSVDLSNPAKNADYARAVVTMPGLGLPGSVPSVAVPATSVAWGLTIPRKSANPENAIAFVNLVLGAAGTAAFSATGPVPISPALVSTSDYARLPKALQPLVTAGRVLP